jgi:hypothetical protein
MSPASFTPEQDLHFVLCDFGRSGQAYVETDPSQADASTIIRNLLNGQYNRPVWVLVLNVEEGWVCPPTVPPLSQTFTVFVAPSASVRVV